MSGNKLIWSKWLELHKKLVASEKEFSQVTENIDTKLRDKEIDEGKWSPKDVLSHIAGWEVEVVKQFKAFLTNPEVNDNYDIDSFNKSAVESRKHLIWDQLVTELKNAQSDLSTFLSNLTQKEVDEEKRFIEWVDILVNHYIHHAKQLKQFY